MRASNLGPLPRRFVLLVGVLTFCWPYEIFSTEVSARENKDRTVVGHSKELFGIYLFAGWGVPEPQRSFW